jgi:peptidoglycan/LPS O-acetylase OafA/YrhL
MVNIKTREFPEIDFLRFIAILLVVVFHFTYLRRTLLPYGNLTDIPPFNIGWVGVQLFFIISGFVVAHTLTRAQNAKQFILKRITRIYPSLFLILPIVFFCQRFIPSSIFKEESTVFNLIGSMTLIPPTLLNQLGLTEFDWLTLVLWTLKVEMQFYFLCYLLFRLFKFEKLLRFILTLSISVGLILMLFSRIDSSHTKLLVIFLQGMGLNHLPWFVIGMLFYQKKVFVVKNNYKIIIVTFIAIGLSIKNQIKIDQLFLLLAVVLFYITVFWTRNSKVVKLRIFQALGFSSYEMYLIHQGVGFPILYFFILKFELGTINSFLLMIAIILQLFLISNYLSKFSSKLISSSRALLKL